MKLTFYGGAKTVTGANYLLETGPAKSGGKKILVDCGLNQGTKYSEDLNYEKFAYNPAEIDYVFLTHSHTDHSGRLPVLYKDGFRGKFFASRATIDMVKVALPDNLNIIKEEAMKENREPLFEPKDLDGILSLAQGYDYEQPIVLGEGLTATLHDAGHILGSTIVEIDYENGKKIFFSGDLGNPPTPLLNYPFFPKDADYIVVESAYGSRIHEDRAERKNILTDTIEETVKKGGTVIIPSFAIERTQELLYELNGLINSGRIQRIPMFVDSPLAIKLTEVYKKYPDYFNKKTMDIIDSGDDIFNFPGLTMTRTVDESKKINDVRGPKVIIAGSGMSNGGRILHHELRYLPDPNSTILFVGYQAQGTLGRRIYDGAKEVKIFGQKVPVNCRVQAISGYSAHADQPQLLKWVASAAMEHKLKKVFVVQGEEDSSDVLAQKIKSDIGVDAIVPNQGESFEI